jgi:hypothetical protein
MFPPEGIVVIGKSQLSMLTFSLGWDSYVALTLVLKPAVRSDLEAAVRFCAARKFGIVRPRGDVCAVHPGNFDVAVE